MRALESGRRPRAGDPGAQGPRGPIPDRPGPGASLSVVAIPAGLPPGAAGTGASWEPCSSTKIHQEVLPRCPPPSRAGGRRSHGPVGPLDAEGPAGIATTLRDAPGPTTVTSTCPSPTAERLVDECTSHLRRNRGILCADAAQAPGKPLQTRGPSGATAPAASSAPWSRASPRRCSGGPPGTTGRSCTTARSPSARPKSAPHRRRLAEE